MATLRIYTFVATTTNRRAGRSFKTWLNSNDGNAGFRAHAAFKSRSSGTHEALKKRSTLAQALGAKGCIESG